MKNNQKLTLLSPNQRKRTIDEIINFFETERDEEIGIIAAEDMLDMLLEAIGNDIYNKGVDDAKNYIQERFVEINIDLESVVKKSNK